MKNKILYIIILSYLFSENTPPVKGCTSPLAKNYNRDATENDGSCIFYYSTIKGCTNSLAKNYNRDATQDDGSCIYTGCTDEIACNYDEKVTDDDDSCIYPEKNYDCDGNCIANLDCLGVCDGDAVYDQCNVCGGNNSTCIDCLGIINGDAVKDKCGVCDSNMNNDCIQDCNGDWGGNAELDQCGVCDSNVDNDCVQDCNGDWGGNSMIDSCGSCIKPSDGIIPNCSLDINNNPNSSDGCNRFVDWFNVNNFTNQSGQVITYNYQTSKLYIFDLNDFDYKNLLTRTNPGQIHFDCNYVCAGLALLDDCGVCDGSNAGQDCAGVCFGDSVLDDCGVCDGSNAGQDCAGVCFGDSALDDCGVCDGSNAGQDCAGVCFGDSALDDCGVCDSNVDNDCIQDCAGTINGQYALCTEEGACNYEECVPGGTCIFAQPNHNCAGYCITDIDDDGICDDVDECIGSYDKCGVCNGGGYPEGACNCAGNVLDSCNVCGGDDSKCSGDKVTDISKNKKRGTAAKDKSFYYMVTGSFTKQDGDTWEFETENDYPFSFSIFGFYGKIKPNTLLGFNQTIRYVDIADYGIYDEWLDLDLWSDDYFYALSYIKFDKKQVGRGGYWRVDIGYAENKIVDLNGSTLSKENGIGMLFGMGYILDNKLLIELSYNLREYDTEYNWYSISVGGLF